MRDEKKRVPVIGTRVWKVSILRSFARCCVTMSPDPALLGGSDHRGRSVPSITVTRELILALHGVTVNADRERARAERGLARATPFLRVQLSRMPSTSSASPTCASCSTA